LRDTFGINHLLTSTTATAQQNVMANAELRIRVRMIGFLPSPTLGILDVRRPAPCDLDHTSTRFEVPLTSGLIGTKSKGRFGMSAD
jgi:hypothetical protein